MFLALWLSCTLEASGPCADYCDYICDCHAGEPEFDCNECRTIYDDSDPELQDACETSLVDLQQADRDAGTGCVSEVDDSGA